MRLPLGETEIGYWYYRDGWVEFRLLAASHTMSLEKAIELGYRITTFARFKQEFPHALGDQKHRTK